MRRMRGATKLAKKPFVAGSGGEGVHGSEKAANCERPMVNVVEGRGPSPGCGQP